MSCGQNDITKSPDHVNFVTLKIEKRSLVTYSTAITIMTRRFKKQQPLKKVGTQRDVS